MLRAVQGWFPGVQPDSRSRFGLTLALHAALLVVVTVVFWYQLVDDSYVFFRYGRNLVEFHAWNWNRAGTHEQAYTSIFYAVLAIVPAILHIDPLVFMKVLGLAMMAFLPLRVWQLTGSQSKFLAAVLLVSMNPYFAIHAFSGMDTVLFVVLLFELFVTLESDVQARQATYRGMLVALMLPLVRPEGMAFSGLYWLSLLVWGNRIRTIQWLVGFITLFVAFYAWNWWYFGQPFPNPFYVKVISEGGGIGKLLGAALGMRIYWFAVLFGILLCSNRRWWMLAAMCCAIALFLYGPAELVMDYANRFRFQVFVPLFLALIVYMRTEPAQNDLALAVLIVLVAWGPVTKEQIVAATQKSDTIRAEAATRRIGEALNRPGGLNVLLYEAGAIPYYSDCNCVDAWGLGTRRITKNHLKFDSLLSEHPDAIVLYQHSKTQTGPSEQLQDEQRFAQIDATGLYEKVAVVHYIHGLWLPVFLRKNSPDFETIKGRLRAIEQ